MELEELKRLLDVDAESVLSRQVPPLGTEYDVLLHELAKMRTLRIANREIEMPGLTRNLGLICQVMAEFKEKEKRNVMALQYAKSDDIVLMGLRLEHIATNIQVQQDITIAATKFVEIFDILPQVSGVFTVPDKQIFIFTDVIELFSPVSLTGIRIADVDGVPQYALDATLPFKATDLQVFELPHPVIADSTFDIDGKVESPVAAATVTTAPWVVGVWIGYGKDVPALATPGA